MADGTTGLIAELIGEALIDAVARSSTRSAEHVRNVWRWLREVAAAPPGVELVAPDGSTYTGIVIVERSQAVILFALRHPPPLVARRQPHFERDEAPFSGRTLFDEGPWPPCDGAPFRR
jgi:hypothetical protein